MCRQSVSLCNSKPNMLKLAFNEVVEVQGWQEFDETNVVTKKKLVLKSFRASEICSSLEV
jgi:hypothetical protein